MAPARRKAPKLVVPQTIEAATAEAAAYADELTHAEQLRVEADRAIAAIQATRDEQLAPLEQRMKDRFRGLQRWWSVAGPAMTDGKRKSIELAGCVIGERTPPPSLVHKGLTAGDAIGALVKAGGASFVRVATTLDRPALIRALRINLPSEASEAEKAAANALAAKLTALGFATKQEDEFFIDRAQPEATDPVVQIGEDA